MQIIPIHHPLNATVRVPGSKSLTNRENILTAIHRLQAQLDTLEMQLAASDFPSLEATLDQAQSQYRRFGS